jgi:hypothetical protein
MFIDQIAAAIDGARSHAALNHVSELIWKGWGQGLVNDDQAGQFAERIHDRKAALENVAAGHVIQGKSARDPSRPSIFPPRRLQRAPVRSVAIERRRTLAASSPLPPVLAARFTTSEVAALRIIADEHVLRSRCASTLAEIAARAGTSRSVVKRALKQAETLGLIRITERPVAGAKHLPNLVHVIDAAWLGWLKRGGRIGVQKRSPTAIQDSKRLFGRERAPVAPPSSSYEREGRPGDQRGSAYNRCYADASG